jgi:hypothetical protein
MSCDDADDAVNTTGVRFVIAAVTVCVPTFEPNVQCVLAYPVVLLVSINWDSVPPPVVTAQVTRVCATGFPY